MAQKIRATYTLTFTEEADYPASYDKMTLDEAVEFEKLRPLYSIAEGLAYSENVQINATVTVVED